MANLKQIQAQIAALTAQNEALAAKIEELEKAGKAGGDTKEIESSLKELADKVVKLEEVAKSPESSVKISKQKKLVPKVPTQTFKVGENEYRCKVAKLSIGGKVMTAQEVVEGPKSELGELVSAYPGLFEIVN